MPHEDDDVRAERRRVDQSISLRERLKIFANRVQFSSEYSYLYGLMILTNSVLLIWIFSNHGSYPNSLTFVLLDCVITLALFMELLIRFTAQGQQFFYEYSNCFDCVVLLLCVLGLVLHASSTSKTAGIEEVAAVAIAAVRYVTQLLRLLVLMKNFKKNTSKAVSDIQIDVGLDPESSPEERSQLVSDNRQT